MSNKQIDELENELRNFDSKLVSLKEESSRCANLINEENVKLNQLEEQRSNLVTRRNKLGFFERLGLCKGEGKQINKEISTIDTKAKEYNTNIEKLNNEANVMLSQEKEVQNNVNNLSNELEKLKKEEQWKQDIRTGKIPYITELVKIETSLNEYEENLREFAEKVELWLTWQKTAEVYGSSSIQANEFWDKALYKYRSSPMEAVVWHSLKVFPSTNIEKLNIINGINKDVTSRSLIEKYEKLKLMERQSKKLQLSLL